VLKPGGVLAVADVVPRRPHSGRLLKALAAALLAQVLRRRPPGKVVDVKQGTQVPAARAENASLALEPVVQGRSRKWG